MCFRYVISTKYDVGYIKEFSRCSRQTSSFDASSQFIQHMKLRSQPIAMRPSKTNVVFEFSGNDDLCISHTVGAWCTICWNRIRWYRSSNCWINFSNWQRWLWRIKSFCLRLWFINASHQVQKLGKLSQVFFLWI